MPPLESGAPPPLICSRRLSSLDWAFANLIFSEATSFLSTSTWMAFAAGASVDGAFPQPINKTAETEIITISALGSNFADFIEFLL